MGQSSEPRSFHKMGFSLSGGSSNTFSLGVISCAVAASQFAASFPSLYLSCRFTSHPLLINVMSFWTNVTSGWSVEQPFMACTIASLEYDSNQMPEALLPREFQSCDDALDVRREAIQTPKIRGETRDPSFRRV